MCVCDQETALRRLSLLHTPKQFVAHIFKFESGEGLNVPENLVVFLYRGKEKQI